VRPPKAKSFWVSSLALVVFACAAALLLGVAAFVLLARTLRRGGLRRRVREFTAGGPGLSEVAQPLSSSPLPALEEMFERTRWWPGFKTEVEIGRIHRTPIELVTLTALCTVAVAVLLGIATGTPVPSLLVFALGPLALRSFVKWQVRKQRELFNDQLPVHLLELASTMRAGHSLVSGLTSVSESAPEPSRTEWARAVADEQLGLPLDEAMEPLARRMACDDISQVALVASLQQRTGGNMAEVLERVAESVRERSELRRELRALTAQARLSRYLVTALPVVVLGAVWLINRNYVKPLFDTSAGVILLCVAVALLVAASQIMRAITEIKV
jgi:tight adherence protein B